MFNPALCITATPVAADRDIADIYASSVCTRMHTCYLAVALDMDGSIVLREVNRKRHLTDNDNSPSSLSTV